jgi:protein gp37
MPLNKSDGNMYDWVTHTHSSLAGECPHQCTYCYVTALGKRWENVRNRHSGPIRLVEDEIKRKFGFGRTIFIEHMSDLFAARVPVDLIERVLAHCAAWPQNTYVFQTKNPGRYADFLPLIPDNSILGTTIETNRLTVDFSMAPSPEERCLAMKDLKYRRFVTVEPILDFDPPVLAGWIADIKPDFLNIGADSKNRGLPEPSKATIIDFLDRLKAAGISVRKKTNLGRLMK